MSHTSIQKFRADMNEQFASLPNRKKWIEVCDGSKETTKQAYSTSKLAHYLVQEKLTGPAPADFNAHVINEICRAYPNLNAKIPKLATFANLIGPLIADCLAKETALKADYKAKCARLKRRMPSF
jgi:hypothetical protein